MFLVNKYFVLLCEWFLGRIEYIKEGEVISIVIAIKFYNVIWMIYIIWIKYCVICYFVENKGVNLIDDDYIFFFWLWS